MRSRRFDWRARAIQVGFVVALLLLWYYLGRSGAVSAIFLPQLPRVAEKFVQIVQSASFYNNLAVTLFELIIVVAIASLFGAPQMAIYAVDRQPFHVIAEGLPIHDRLPPR